MCFSLFSGDMLKGTSFVQEHVEIAKIVVRSWEILGYLGDKHIHDIIFPPDYHMSNTLIYHVAYIILYHLLFAMFAVSL